MEAANKEIQQMAWTSFNHLETKEEETTKRPRRAELVYWCKLDGFLNKRCFFPLTVRSNSYLNSWTKFIKNLHLFRFHWNCNLFEIKFRINNLNKTNRIWFDSESFRWCVGVTGAYWRNWSCWRNRTLPGQFVRRETRCHSAFAGQQKHNRLKTLRATEIWRFYHHQ